MRWPPRSSPPAERPVVGSIRPDRHGQDQRLDEGEEREIGVVWVSEASGRVGDGPRVLNLVGVGGIGKSRLPREIRHHHCGGSRTASIDLQVPAMRRQKDALAAMRAALAAQGTGYQVKYLIRDRDGR